ncbi:MAG TPA: flagellar export chaperone FliS, partial [Bacillota bacterium]|nr:flagellar export chaperone FliS [Bacillota bacterium]
KLASSAIEGKKMDIAHTNLLKVQDILDELSYAVDTEKGGEIGESLLALYDYMKRRLVEANIKKDSAIIGEVVDLISNLRETWQEAMKTGQGSNG